METTDSSLYRDLNAVNEKLYMNIKHPLYIKCENRYLSFQDWPKHLKPTAKELSHAGFVYAGRGDVVFCFCCGIHLKHWEPEDKAWTEHYRYSPSCTYLNMCRVQRFDKPLELFGSNF